MARVAALVAAAAAFALPAAGAVAPRYLVSSFVLPSYATQLALYGPGGTLSRVLATAAARPALAQWSPDGTMLAWVEQDGLVVERADGSHRRLLVPGCHPRVCEPCVPLEFTWSPDGTRLLVSGTGPKTGGLSIVPLATGRPRAIAEPRPHVRYQSPLWSGAAAEIAFVRDGGDIGSAGCCSARLVVARPDGSHERTLFSARDAIKDEPRLSWSPDGRWIAFTTQAFDPRDPACAVVDPATGARTVVPLRYASVPVWAPDSSRFAVGDARSPADLFTPSGTRVGSVGPKHAVLEAWTPAGLYLSASRRLLVFPGGAAPAHVALTLPPGRFVASAQPTG